MANCECHNQVGYINRSSQVTQDMWLVRPGVSATPMLSFDVSGHEERGGRSLTNTAMMAGYD